MFNMLRIKTERAANCYLMMPDHLQPVSSACLEGSILNMSDYAVIEKGTLYGYGYRGKTGSWWEIEDLKMVHELVATC